MITIHISKKQNWKPERQQNTTWSISLINKSWSHANTKKIPKLYINRTRLCHKQNLNRDFPTMVLNTGPQISATGWTRYSISIIRLHTSLYSLVSPNIIKRLNIDQNQPIWSESIGQTVNRSIPTNPQGI